MIFLFAIFRFTISYSSFAYCTLIFCVFLSNVFVNILYLLFHFICIFCTLDAMPFGSFKISGKLSFSFLNSSLKTDESEYYELILCFSYFDFCNEFYALSNPNTDRSCTERFMEKPLRDLTSLLPIEMKSGLNSLETGVGLYPL